MLLMLLRLLETRLLLDVSSVSRKTWLPSPARGQSIFHLTSSFTSSSLAAVPLFWLDSTRLCSTLFYFALLVNLPLSRPTDRSEEKRISHSLRSPTTSLTLPTPTRPASPSRPTTTTTTTSNPGLRRTLFLPSIVSSLSSLSSLSLFLAPHLCSCSPTSEAPSDHLCQRPQTVA